MDRRSEFLESINVKNDLKYRYYNLDRRIQKYVNETLNKNNINKLLCMIHLYPNKRKILEEIMQMYYSDTILTENSLKVLEDLYKGMKGGV